MRSAAVSLSMACSKKTCAQRPGTGMCPAAAGGGASGKSHAFCSKQRRAGQDARIPRLRLQPVGEPQQGERMLGLAVALEAACDLLAGHRAVACVVLGGGVI